MNIKETDLKNEDFELDCYWIGDDFIIELKDRTVKIPNAYLTSINYDFEVPPSEEITIVGNSKVWDK